MLLLCSNFTPLIHTATVEPIQHGQSARDYLQKHVNPVLTKALAELCKQKPEDPLVRREPNPCSLIPRPSHQPKIVCEVDSRKPWNRDNLEFLLSCWYSKLLRGFWMCSLVPRLPQNENMISPRLRNFNVAFWSVGAWERGYWICFEQLKSPILCMHYYWNGNSIKMVLSQRMYYCSFANFHSMCSSSVNCKFPLLASSLIADADCSSHPTRHG